MGPALVALAVGVAMEIGYLRDLREEGRRLRLRIASDGAASLTFDSNDGLPGIPGIGLFRARPAPERVARLREALQAPAFAGLPALVHLDPGEPIRVLSLGDLKR